MSQRQLQPSPQGEESEDVVRQGQREPGANVKSQPFWKFVPWKWIVVPIMLYALGMWVDNPDDQTKYTIDMLHYMIPTDKLYEFEKSHARVKGAIYSIAPEYRHVKKSHQVLRIPLSKLDDVIPVITKQVASDLGVDELYPQLAKKISSIATFADIGLEGAKDLYSDIKLSFAKGGKSHFVVGVVGFQRDKDTETIIFGVTLYQEDWKEQDWVQLNAQSTVWEDAEIEKFAYYLLYEHIQTRQKLIL